MNSSKRECWNSNPEKWEKILSGYLSRTKIRLVSRPKILHNRSRVITECKHGIIDRACGSLERVKSCCKKGSKDSIPSINSTPEKWERVLYNYLQKTGVNLISRPDRLTAKSKIITECKHGKISKFCETLEYSSFCCKKCATPHGFKSFEKEKPAKIYLVEYFDEGVLHYKLGITRKSVKQRLRSRLFRVIKTWNLTLEKCFLIEQKALSFAEDFGWRYSSSSTTELIHSEGVFKTIDYIDSLV
jgi:hypothetical protein